jgi:hypothetical protein
MLAGTANYSITCNGTAGSASANATVTVNASSTQATSVVSIPAGTKWYWQLQGTINNTRTATVYDIDLFDNTAAEIATLKGSGHIVICYFSAGTYEPGRPDSSQFPAAAIGSAVSGWPGEYWLDVTNSTVKSIMTARMDLAKSKGCDGLEPDNVDGYSNKPGFSFTMNDQITFNKFLATEAHNRGLAVALKNATDLVSSLASSFDFAVVEQCFEYNECSLYSPFVALNKAVLNAEYTAYSAATCTQAAGLKFSTAFYNLALDGSLFSPCP